MVDVSNEKYIEDLGRINPYIRHLTDGKDKTMLITGATGLIGSFLTDAIAAYNHSSVSGKIRLFITTRNKRNALERFGHLNDDEIVFIEQDISEGFPDDIIFDYIIHLASNADPASYKAYPYETIETNVAGTLKMIKYLKNHKDTKAVFTSTMEVYGETEVNSISEQDYGMINFNDLRAGYPESKRVSELLIRSSIEEYDVSCVIARLGYIYGPTMKENDSKIVAELIKKAYRKESVILKTPGSQRRSYCYVSDAAAGLLKLLNSGVNGDVYNVADKNSVVTIRELAELVCELYGLELTVGNERMTRVTNDSVLDASKLEKLGWLAKINIHDGIQRSVESIIL